MDPKPEFRKMNSICDGWLLGFRAFVAKFSNKFFFLTI